MCVLYILLHSDKHDKHVFLGWTAGFRAAFVWQDFRATEAERSLHRYLSSHPSQSAESLCLCIRAHTSFKLQWTLTLQQSIHEGPFNILKAPQHGEGTNVLSPKLIGSESVVIVFSCSPLISMVYNRLHKGSPRTREGPNFELPFTLNIRR